MGSEMCIRDRFIIRIEGHGSTNHGINTLKKICCESPAFWKLTIDSVLPKIHSINSKSKLSISCLVNYLVITYFLNS